MLNKQAIDISFAQGLDTKTDPKRVKMGKFLELENTAFDKGGLLQKRQGYAKLAELANDTYSYLTTFNQNLTAIGNNIAAYNPGAAAFVERGSIQPLSVDTLPVIRNNLNQTACDVVVAPNGIACAVYLESDGMTTTNKFVVFDVVTGQNLKAPAVIPVATGTVTGGMRVFRLGMNFIMVFTNVITGVSHLQYVTVNTVDPSIVGPNTDIASSYDPATTLSWDGHLVGSNLFFAYNTLAGGQSIKVTYLTQSLILVTPVTFATYKASMMTMTADITIPSSPVIYVSFIRSDTETGYSLAVDQNLGTLMAPQPIFPVGPPYRNIISAAQDGVCSIAAEIENNPFSLNANFVIACTVTQATSTVTPFFVSIRSVGLASKAFIVEGVIYYLAAFKSTYQPTYFLINGSLSTSASPVVSAKLAYENGGGYLTLGLPSVTVSDGNVAQVPYLFKDLIQAVNKNTNVPTGSQTAGIYSQTGINLGTFTIGTENLDTAEIGNDLHITGGFLWMYDGYLPVEHNFFLFPDVDPSTPPDDSAVWVATGGSMAARPDGSTNTNAYFYQFTYEWTDNQGNAFRSAPSIPVPVTTTGSGTIGSVVIQVPTLRLTMKVANPVKIVIYRWSVAQQNYFQVTSITSPLLNDTTVDYVTYTDTQPDAAILGNNLIYTTGGVVEDTNAPASDLLTLFDTRLWLVDAEDQNLLWYSKQVIENTPVEMSDLFTVYVPPTTATQGATGPITSISVMDDKLIIGKRNAFLYINGSGPDNTGANNQYSQPIFITSTAGCTNQKSMILTPHGLMFQSNKGIWILARNLQASYIGAPVQDFTLGATVLSAVTVPGTNQVRFTLDTGITLTYDYFYDQWSTFTGVPSVSSCIYQEFHTFLKSNGIVYQEHPGVYIDGSSPVLIRFKTGPIRLGDLQGYQRAYFFYLLGTYLSPHKLLLSITYDYDAAPSQTILITPINGSQPFGYGEAETPFGQGTPFGGPGSEESWRVFLERQRCAAFSITLQEIFDPSLDQAPGAGLTLSGINAVCGFKKGYKPQDNATSVG